MLSLLVLVLILLKSAGRKDEAKKTAVDNGVSVTPGVSNLTTLCLLGLYKDKKALLALAAEHKLDIDTILKLKN